jgi:hypothetical protein
VTSARDRLAEELGRYDIRGVTPQHLADALLGPRGAVAELIAEAVAEARALLPLIAHDLRLHGDEWPLARQFARRLEAVAAVRTEVTRLV